MAAKAALLGAVKRVSAPEMEVSARFLSEIKPVSVALLLRPPVF